MARMTAIELRDVRCFEGAQSARLGRITLLVGENGTGKSTFLGCYNALAKFANLHDLEEINHFDDEPFHMPSFKSVVREGKTAFAIGAQFDGHCHNSISLDFQATTKGQPIDYCIDLTYPGHNGSTDALELNKPDDPNISLHVKGPGFEFDLLRGEISFRSISTWLSRYIRNGYYPFGGEIDVFKRNASGEVNSERQAMFVKFTEWLKKSDKFFPPPSSFQTLAFDPALPRRMPRYDSPPRYLVGADGTDLNVFLKTIGRKLGLWRDIRMQKSSDGQDFKILVETPSGPRNLVEVGYGVHSLVPLLSAVHECSENTVVLLQQPETHVHPQAQAELAQWMVGSGHSFVIETHSDHFIDRFRICVKDGVLNADDLSIVYFEQNKKGLESRMHSMSVDRQGNLLGVPRCYRSFFLNEADRLLGFR